MEKNYYLGIQLQSDLRWNAQVEHAAGKASRTLGMLKRTIRVISVKVKTEDDGIYITGQANYGTTAWDPYTNKNITKLEAIQRSAARYITMKKLTTRERPEL